jgi:hypothetical protein
LLQLEQYRIGQGLYVFPAHMICEKADTYFTDGGHMNIGENKKSGLYRTIVSTWWMREIKGVMQHTL